MGAQRPTHLLTPDGRFDFTEGDIAIELAASLGLDLLDWQRWIVRWILAIDESGRPACMTVILCVPRQNGKGAVLEALELYWLIVAGVKTVIHTAHEADTAAGHMERIEALTLEPGIDLPSIRTYKSNGKERTRNLDEKLVLQYRTRTKATKRGASPQRVVLDESQELQAAHIAALVPAMAAQSMDHQKLPQMIYTGSAPLEHSKYMHELIERVLEKRPPRTLLAMWACEAGDDPDDVDNWYKSNPSLGVLISEDWVRDGELLVMEIEDFLAERMGIPKKPKNATRDAGPIDLEMFARLGRRVGAEYDKATAVLACDVAYDRSWTSFGVVGVAPDGFVQCRFVGSIPGTHGAAERAKELSDELGGVSIVMAKDEPLIDAVEKAGVTVVPLSGADRARAAQKFVDACNGTTKDENDNIVGAPILKHRGEPQVLKALELAAWKPYGSSGNTMIDVRGSDGDVSPLRVLTLAYGRLGADVEGGPSVYEQRGMAVIG